MNCTSALSGLVPFLFIYILAFILNSPHRSPAVVWGHGLERPPGKRGIIVLVSRVDSAMFAIHHHLVVENTLEKIWLIPSDGRSATYFGKSSNEIALQIKTQAQELAQSIGRLDLKIEIHPHGVSPAESQDTFDAVNRIFRHSGLHEKDVIADFTGGTKPMSVGMIMACLKSDRDLEYVSFNQQSYGPFLVDYQYSAFDLIG